MLVHAGIADRRMWRAYLPWLADEGWHAIAPDLPGFGEHVPPAHHVIAGAGHLAPLEAPEAFRALPVGFLAELAG